MRGRNWYRHGNYVVERGFAVSVVSGFRTTVVTMGVKSKVALLRLLEPVPRDCVGKYLACALEFVRRELPVGIADRHRD